MSKRTYHIDERDELGGWEPVMGFTKLTAARREYRMLVSRSRTKVFRLRRVTGKQAPTEEVLDQSRKWKL